MGQQGKIRKEGKAWYKVREIKERKGKEKLCESKEDYGKGRKD